MVCENTAALKACVWLLNLIWNKGKDHAKLMAEMIQRHITFTPDQLAAESLKKPVGPIELKKDLLSLLEETRKTLQA